MSDYGKEEVRNLRVLRESVPLSQVVAAVAINVRPATLSSWENGRSVPKLTLTDWYRLADLYHVSLDELRTAVDASQKKSEG